MTADVLHAKPEEDADGQKLVTETKGSASAPARLRPTRGDADAKKKWRPAQANFVKNAAKAKQGHHRASTVRCLAAMVLFNSNQINHGNTCMQDSVAGDRRPGHATCATASARPCQARPRGQATATPTSKPATSSSLKPRTASRPARRLGDDVLAAKSARAPASRKRSMFNLLILHPFPAAPLREQLKPPATAKCGTAAWSSTAGGQKVAELSLALSPPWRGVVSVFRAPVPRLCSQAGPRLDERALGREQVHRGHGRPQIACHGQVARGEPAQVEAGRKRSRAQSSRACATSTTSWTPTSTSCSPPTTSSPPSRGSATTTTSWQQPTTQVLKSPTTSTGTLPCRQSRRPTSTWSPRPSRGGFI